MSTLDGGGVIVDGAYVIDGGDPWGAATSTSGGLLDDWQIEWRGLRMGDGTDYVIQSVTGLNDTPGVRTSDTTRARAHGQHAGTDMLEGRAVQADILIAGAHPGEPVWSEFSRAHVVGITEELPLLVQVPGVAGGRTVQIMCRARRLSLPSDQDYAAGVGAAAVEWWATDPRIYDALATQLSATMATATTSGLTFPATFPLSFGGAVEGGLVTAVNAGEFPAPWVAAITGPISDPRIENVTTGQTLSFSGSLSAGEVLVVESARRAVTLGDSSRYAWLRHGSQWFDLAPGENTLRLAGGAGSGSMHFEFRSCWI